MTARPKFMLADMRNVLQGEARDIVARQERLVAAGVLPEPDREKIRRADILFAASETIALVESVEGEFKNLLRNKRAKQYGKGRMGQGQGG